MAFDVVQKPAFYNDLFSLPRHTQRRISRAVQRIQDDPYSAGGQSKRCLKHLYRNVYRYRIGDYRLLYSVGDRCVCLLGIGLRDDVYDRFHAKEEDLTPEVAGADSAEPQVIPTAAYDSFTEVSATREARAEGRSGLEPEEEEGDDGSGPQLLAELLDVWGVDPIHRTVILQCETVDELLDIDVPEDVKEKLLHWHQPPDIEQILEQPTMELRHPSDLDRYMDGSLKRFLLKLDPEQERVASRTLQGPTLVKGGPGTGKSLVALYRLKNLVEAPRQGALFARREPRILFVTYTRALINVSGELLDELLDDMPATVDVMTLDSKVRDIITGAELPFRPASERDQREALAEALQSFSAGGNTLRRAELIERVSALRPDYLLEEFHWVLEGRGLDSLGEYLAEERAGRGIRFDRSLRAAVWELHQEYLTELDGRGLATWNAYRRRARDVVGGWDKEQLYDVVIIDEAQDLTPVALGLCVDLCRHPTGLYLTADASQSIYSRGFSWQRVHDDLQVRGRTTVLKRNYRMTEQIAEAAGQLLLDHGGGDAEVLDGQAVHWGPKPILYGARSTDDEDDAIAAFLRESSHAVGLPLGSGAVLVRTNRLAEEVAQGLTRRGIPAKHVRSEAVTLDSGHVRVMTMHSAKGLEFPFVAVARMTRWAMPMLPRDMQEEEREDHVMGERRLLFVALSRAMRRLLVAYDRSSPSPFVAEFNPELWMRS